MKAKEIITKVKDIISQSTCDEKELYELLLDEADIWKMRVEELEKEEE